MRKLALLLPVDDEPVVVSRNEWDTAAMAVQLGCRHGYARIVPLRFRVAPTISVVMATSPVVGGTPNVRAAALAGTQVLPITGPALLLGISTLTAHPTSMERDELLLLAVRILIAETVSGYMPSPGKEGGGDL